MKINRQKGNINTQNTQYNNMDKVNISLDINILDLLVRYSISSSSLIKKGQYMNLKSLIDMISLDFYNTKPGSVARLKFIAKALEGRISYNLEEPANIVHYAVDHSGVSTEDINLQFKELSSGDITYINELVCNNLNTSYLYKYIDDGIQKLTALKVAQPDKLYQCTEDLISYVTTLSNEFRQNHSQSVNDKPFTLGSNLREELEEAYKTITSTRRILHTGCQGLDMVLGGGLENTRVYLLVGLGGSGKSTVMLDMVYQIKKYNREYVTKDPTKRPCIVYLTQENSEIETITRLFQMATGKRMADCERDELYDMMVEAGACVTPDSPIDIMVIYKPDRSIDTSYLYQLYDDLADRNYEVICVFQDHIKRIKSAEKEKDVRLELGKVVNEFKTFATLKDIPFFSCCHFNREAAAAIEAVETNKSHVDPLKALGKHNIGESFLMIDNSDLTLAFTPHYDEDGIRWDGYKVLKKRVETALNQIYQPCYPDNNIKMVEDAYGEPLYKDSVIVNTGFNNSINNKPPLNKPMMGSISSMFPLPKETPISNNLVNEEEIEKMIVSIDTFKKVDPGVREIAIRQMKEVYPVATKEQKARIDYLLSIKESECIPNNEDKPLIEVDDSIEIIKSNNEKLPILQSSYPETDEQEEINIKDIKRWFSGKNSQKEQAPYRVYRKDEEYHPYIVRERR